MTKLAFHNFHCSKFTLGNAMSLELPIVYYGNAHPTIGTITICSSICVGDGVASNNRHHVGVVLTNRMPSNYGLARV